MAMDKEIRKLVVSALSELSKLNSKDDIEKIRIKYLGRKNGLFTNLTKKIKTLSTEQKQGIGTLINHSQKKIEEALSNKLMGIKGPETSKRYDVTKLGKTLESGTLHPITQVVEEVKEIFKYLGFTWTDGPEIENDLYNFKKLNIPKDHPARDTQQTYYLENDLVLRTHTSNMQVRYMKDNKPPISVLSPGRVYRRELPDATHFPAFFQIEGLKVGTNVPMTDLLGSLDYFAKRLFGENSKLKVYGHHFPYTEPSVEIEVYHPKKGWLEILGAGMVHPKVLRENGIDPNKYQGWAFGIGADRIAMLKYDIDDIRILFDNDLRFLTQF